MPEISALFDIWGLVFVDRSVGRAIFMGFSSSPLAGVCIICAGSGGFTGAAAAVAIWADCGGGSDLRSRGVDGQQYREYVEDVRYAAR